KSSRPLARSFTDSAAESPAAAKPSSMPTRRLPATRRPPTLSGRPLTRNPGRCRDGGWEAKRTPCRSSSSENVKSAKSWAHCSNGRRGMPPQARQRALPRPERTRRKSSHHAPRDEPPRFLAGNASEQDTPRGGAGDVGSFALVPEERPSALVLVR